MSVLENDRIRVYDNTSQKEPKGYVEPKQLHINGGRYAGGILGEWATVQAEYAATSTAIPPGSVIRGGTNGRLYLVRTGADTTSDPELEVYDPTTGFSTNYQDLTIAGIAGSPAAIAAAIDAATGNPVDEGAVYFWMAATTYTHPVYVLGSDAKLYKSQPAGDLTNDPVSSPADWSGPFLWEVPEKAGYVAIVAWSVAAGGTITDGDYATAGGSLYRLKVGGDGTVDPTGGGGAAEWEGPFLLEGGQQLKDANIVRWDSGNSSSYTHPVYAIGSDEQLYLSKVAGDLTQNPVTSPTEWDGPYVIQVQQASMTVAGVIEIADPSETGSVSTDKALTPSGLVTAMFRNFVVNSGTGDATGGADGKTFDTFGAAWANIPDGAQAVITLETDVTFGVGDAFSKSNCLVIIRGDTQARKFTFPDNFTQSQLNLSIGCLIFQRLTVDWGMHDPGTTLESQKQPINLLYASTLVFGNLTSDPTGWVICNQLAGATNPIVFSGGGLNNVTLFDTDITGDAPGNKFVYDASRTDFNFQSANTTLTDIVVPAEGVTTIP